MKNNLNLKYKLFRKGVAALAATMVIGSGAGSFNDALANASHEHEYVIDIDNEIENEVRLANASKKEIELKQLEEKKDITISKNAEHLHSVRINPINSSILTVLKTMIATKNNCINKNGHKFSNRTKKVYTKNEQNGIHNVIAYQYCLECGKIKVVKTTEYCAYTFKFEDANGLHMECPKCSSEKVIEHNKSNPTYPSSGGSGGGNSGGNSGGNGGTTTPVEPEKPDVVIDTIIEHRSNDDGTHKVVKVEIYKSGKKVEIVLNEKENCDMGAWTIVGSEETRSCPKCNYKEKRPYEKPEEDVVIDTIIEHRSNDDGTHKVVKVETYKSGKKVEIVLKEKETCNMGPWTNNGAAGEISICPDCKYEKTRDHNLSGKTQDNYTYVGKDANGNYTHKKTSAEACANGCGYVDEKNPKDDVCTYVSDATVNADGITVQNTCQYCHEIEVIHIHDLKIEYVPKEISPGVYDPDCGTKKTTCTDPNCNYDKNGNGGSPYIKEEVVRHSFTIPASTSTYPIINVDANYQMVAYGCDQCGYVKYIKEAKTQTNGLVEEAETNGLKENYTILSTLRRYKEYLLNALNVDNNKNKTKTKVLK